MSRTSKNVAENEDRPGQAWGSLKRKPGQLTVAPGSYLCYAMQARQGLKAAGFSAANPAARGSSGAPRAPTIKEVPVPLLFVQRTRYLQHHKQKGTPQPYRLNEELPVGLLSLPEDVLLKIMCYLRHDEIKPLFQVCKQLSTTLKTAVDFHFNYATPFRANEEPGPPQQLGERNKKRAVTNLAAVLSHLTRSGRLTAEARAASGHTTAPRALTFADGAAAAAGASMRVAALA